MNDPAFRPSPAANDADAAHLRAQVERLRAILAEAVPANATPEHTMSLAGQLRWHQRRTPAGRDWDNATQVPLGVRRCLSQLDRQVYALSSLVDVLRAHDSLEQTVDDQSLGHYVTGGLFEAACLLARQQELLVEEIADQFPEVSQ